MDDPNQIEVPPSFLLLYTGPSGQRLVEPMRVVRERYELCEDLAQLLIDKATSIQFASGDSKGEVLGQLRTALAREDSPVSPTEAAWVITRLAELLGWSVSDS